MNSSRHNNNFPNSLSYVVVFIMFVFTAAINMNSALARDLRRVPISAEEHDPLYIDHDSIHRTGNVVQFKRVLNTPIFGDARAERRWQSNEIELAIDCKNKTIWIAGILVAFAGPAATGNSVGSYSATDGEKKPKPIDMRKGSTDGYLARYVCTNI